MLRLRPHALHSARRALLQPRPRPQLLLQARTYVDGARADFDQDYDADNSAARRKRLRALLAALAPDEAAAAHAHAELEGVMAAHAQGGVFRDRAELESAVRAAQEHLASGPQGSLVQSLPKKAEAESTGGSADAAAAAAAPAVVEDEPDEPSVVELSEAERRTIYGLRLSLALPRLLPLWEREVYAADPELPLPRVLEVAHALASGAPQAALGLELPAAALSEPTPAQVSEAAVRVVTGAHPLFVELLRRSELLLPKEEERLKALDSAVLVAAMRRETLFGRVRRMLGSPAVPPDALGDGVLKAAAQRAPRETQLYACLGSEAALHEGLAAAFFGYHDRRTTRWRRTKATGKYLGIFFSLNILDFVMSNV